MQSAMPPLLWNKHRNWCLDQVDHLFRNETFKFQDTSDASCSFQSGYFRCLLTSSREKKAAKTIINALCCQSLTAKGSRSFRAKMCWSKKCHQNEPMAHSQHEASTQRATKNFGCDMCLLLAKFLRLPSMDTSYKVQNITKPQVQYECIPPTWPRVGF